MGAKISGSGKRRFDFCKITNAMHFLRAFSEGNTFGSETEGVQELLSFVDYTLSERQEKPEREKLKDIAHISGTWREGGYGLFRFGNIQRNRRIHREPFNGELYVEYLRVRYRRSDFPPEDE